MPGVHLTAVANPPLPLVHMFLALEEEEQEEEEEDERRVPLVTASAHPPLPLVQLVLVLENEDHGAVLVSVDYHHPLQAKQLDLKEHLHALISPAPQAQSSLL